MPLRPRPAAPAPGASARLEALLPQPAGGWTLPPEPAEGIEADVPEGAPEPPVDPRAPAVSWQPPRPQDDGPRPVPGAHAPRGPGSRLPGALAVGRFDPGRRGAVALLLVALLAALVAAGVVLRGRPQEVAVPAVLRSGAPLPGASAPPEQAPAQVVVAVGGTVRRPGLVRLPAGSRVDDAVRAAGGVRPGGSTGLLNLARKLVDGEQVLVGVDPPAAGGAELRGGAEQPGGAAPAGRPGQGGRLLDLNTATVGDLDALPGLGPVLAQRIVDWRTEHGRFASVDQLREVTGIGEAKFADLRDKVTV